MQLKFFERDPKPSDGAPTWKCLRQDDRLAVITVLARLLAKTVRADSRRDDHER